MTSREDDLHQAWAELADAEGEHDVEHARRAWARLRDLQQRRPDDAVGPVQAARR